jgi:hypothetical protein
LEERKPPCPAAAPVEGAFAVIPPGVLDAALVFTTEGVFDATLVAGTFDAAGVTLGVELAGTGAGAGAGAGGGNVASFGAGAGS